MKKHFSIYRLSLILLCMLFAGSMLLSGCGDKTTSASSQTSTEVSVKYLGEGAKSFEFTVTTLDGNETSYLISTDAETVGDALLSLNLIEGDDSEYGLYVKKVNGILADYDTDQTYWAFYDNGQYATSGVDTTEILEGHTYGFKIEK